MPNESVIPAQAGIHFALANDAKKANGFPRPRE
jgi:hypothetical protein